MNPAQVSPEIVNPRPDLVWRVAVWLPTLDRTTMTLFRVFR
jgi:hypothetical protein